MGFLRRRRLARQRVLPWIPPLARDDHTVQLDLLRWGDAVARIRGQVLYSYIRGPRALEGLHAALDHGRLYRQAGQELVSDLAQSWRQLRAAIYWRDGGRCMVCGYEDFGPQWERYECGHIVDRCVGGPDHMSNLVVQCVLCNRLKGVTETREKYLCWARQGDPFNKIFFAALQEFSAVGANFSERTDVLERQSL